MCQVVLQRPSLREPEDSKDTEDIELHTLQLVQLVVVAVLLAAVWVIPTEDFSAFSAPSPACMQNKKCPQPW